MQPAFLQSVLTQATAILYIHVEKAASPLNVGIA